jgi:CNT family concentrative nucleoside transporter
MAHLQSALGVAAMLLFAWAISANRRAVDWKSAGVALLVKLATAVLPLKIPAIKAAFAGVNRAVDAVSAASLSGTSFVFGYIGGAPTSLAHPSLCNAYSVSSWRRCAG